jgi:hypothetical protein
MSVVLLPLSIMGIVTIVIVSTLSPEHWPRQGGESAVKTRLLIAWHHWRLHDIKHTANGDVICWSCARRLHL